MWATGVGKEWIASIRDKFLREEALEESTHNVLTNFLETPDYGINRAIVFSNKREIFKKKGVTYLPIYYCMFLHNEHSDEPVILPELELV